MNSPEITLKEEELDIKAVSLDILRQLYSASKKLLLYPLGHPITNETLKKPLEWLNDIFRFKNTFVIQTFGERLLAEGLLLDETVFVKGLSLDLKKHNIKSVEFSANLALGDLYHFLNKLLEPRSPTNDYFQRYLDSKGVRTIKINGLNPLPLYNFDETVIGSPRAKYFLHKRVKELILANPDVLFSYYFGKLKNDDQVAHKLGVDLRLPFLANSFSSVLSEMPEEAILDVFKQFIFSSNWLGEIPDVKVLESIRHLWKDYSRRNNNVRVLLSVYNLFKSVGATPEILDLVFDKGALARLKAIRDAEEIIGFLKSSQAREVDFDYLKRTVFKLAVENHLDALEQLLEQLLSCLDVKHTDTRQRGLRLTIKAVETLADGSFWEMFNGLVKGVVKMALKLESNPEIVELVGWIANKSVSLHRWDELKICIQTLKNIARKSSRDKKKLADDRLAELGDSSIIVDILVDAVVTGKGDSELYESISSIASQKIALSLIEKIDSSDKTVRARVIKALIGMGKSIGPEVTRILANIIGEGEKTDDETWYRMRNIMRVIGHIKYIEALPYFEVISGWRQKRIKLEVISACEAMESPATGAILSRLAVDSDDEVRKAAVVAMGMSGHPDMVKYLRILFDDERSARVLLIVALGRIGGSYARDILIDLYENENIFKDLNISKKEEEDIKVAILKSLSKIGDDVSKSRIELYSKKQSDKSGLFKKDVLSQTAKILLNGNQSLKNPGSVK